jgi:hypothetical protein
MESTCWMLQGYHVASCPLPYCAGGETLTLSHLLITPVLPYVCYSASRPTPLYPTFATLPRSHPLPLIMSFTIRKIEINARDGMYRQCSGAAVATARCVVRLSQMKLDLEQRPVSLKHVNSIKNSMDEEGVHRGDVVHAYIDVADEGWGNRSKEDAIELLNALGPQTKPDSCETVLIGILPKDIRLHPSQGHSPASFPRTFACICPMDNTVCLHTANTWWNVGMILRMSSQPLIHPQPTATSLRGYPRPLQKSSPRTWQNGLLMLNIFVSNC